MELITGAANQKDVKKLENIERLPRNAAFPGNRRKGTTVDEDPCEATQAATARCSDRGVGSP